MLIMLQFKQTLKYPICFERTNLFEELQMQPKNCSPVENAASYKCMNNSIFGSSE
jgi:hypothetical protein